MEVHEIVNRLHRMAVNTGTLNCLGCGYEHNCMTDGCAVMRKAAKKLEELNTFEQTNSCRLMMKLSEEREKHRWIPVAERLPDNASHPGALCKRCMVMTKYGVTEGWYNPDRESWYVLVWFMKERIREYDIDFVSGDIPRVVKVPLHNGIVSAWMPLPEPYEPEDVKQEV